MPIFFLLNLAESFYADKTRMTEKKMKNDTANISLGLVLLIDVLFYP
jgi:hypothetical protein